MLKIIVCFLVLINISPVFAATYRTVSPYRTYTSPYNSYNRNYYTPPRYYNPVNLPARNLNALERYALNKSYARENDIQRLERLENLAFGAVQNGDLNYRFNQVENAILARPNYNNYRSSVLNSLGNYFAGKATGVTPSIITQDLTPSYNNAFYTGASPQYTTQNIMQYSTSPFGTNGYRILNQSNGSGGSVRILD